MALTLVGGEPVDVLLETVRRMRTKKRRDGVTVNFTVPSEYGIPFQRALMRVSAELLLQDADALAEGNVEVRTEAQRMADALVALVVRVTDAVDGS
jgi:hypothetical protein